MFLSFKLNSDKSNKISWFDEGSGSATIASSSSSKEIKSIQIDYDGILNGILKVSFPNPKIGIRGATISINGSAKFTTTFAAYDNQNYRDIITVPFKMKVQKGDVISLRALQNSGQEMTTVSYNYAMDIMDCK